MDHGTGVAGLIGSRRNSSGDMVGVAWNTRLHPYSFLGRAGSQYKLNELIAASLGQPDVRVINISAGTRADIDGQLKEALCNAIDSGRLIVAAAGNPSDASCQQTDIYPAAYNSASALCDDGTPLQSGLLVVGATDIDNQLAQWDNAGQPQCSNQQYVDLYAPGKDVITLSTEHGYSLKSGTSYAAALVSGAASIAWTVDPGDTPQQIQDRIVSRAALLTDVETTSPLYTTDTRVAGERFLDLYRTVGGQDAIVTPDTTPDAFTLQPQSDAPLQTFIVSEPVTITGLDSPAPIHIEGGYYSLDNNSFTNAAGVIHNDQQLWVQVRSAETPNTSRDATVTLGGVSQVYRVTTREAMTTPGDFQFLEQTGVARNTLITSASQLITGIDDGTTISISSDDNGEYAINGGPFTTAAGTLNNGDAVQVRVTSSADYATVAQATVTIGTVSRDFTVVTALADTTPDGFVFNAQTDVPRNSTQTSNTLTITGLTAPAVISISGGEYALDGGAFTATTGYITNGQTVQLRQIAAVSFGATTSATLTVGGISGRFNVTTLAADTIPDDFSFTPQPNVTPGTLITSNTITVSGINTATAITISGGEYAIDGGAFTADPGTVTNGQTVQVRVTSPATQPGTVNATLTIGGVSRLFSVSTAGADTTPDAFSFTAQTNAPLNTPVTSETVTITGINTETPVSIVDGDYAIDGGPFTNAAGTITNGQTVQVRHTSSSLPGDTTIASLTVGSVTEAFSVTTIPPDTTPDDFSFAPRTNVTPGTLITSNSVLISGINTAAPISISAGSSYAINGAAFTG
ncbi:MAG: S8 family serine peptidase, partial [Gammaproteobacteria bacterium]